MEKKFKLGVIGAGFMSKAIVNGLILSKTIRVDDVFVSDVSLEALKSYDNIGVATTMSNDEVFSQSEYVLLAIKPQTFYSLENVKLDSCVKVVSIMAGVNKAKIKEKLGCEKVARCMPNTPVSVGFGAVGIDAEDFTLKEEREFIIGLFSSVSKVVLLNESKLGAVTGISGSAPAYFYLFAKSLMDAGVKNGLTNEDAEKLVVATMKGSAHMIENRGDKSLEDLITAVCSKGGTTIEAINVFKNFELPKIVDNAVFACINRANELENGESKAIDVYTDGACSGNPGKGGYCAIILINGEEIVVSGGKDETTSNRMELLAVIKGLEAIEKPSKINIYSDSSYVINAFNQGWIDSWLSKDWHGSDGREVKNVDLWKRLLSLYKTHKVNFIKVKGHSDNPYNNKCDKIAVEQYKKA
ncbi:MAG: pyrroline-5-carboxylate reductase [Clostridia bacterium]|nr:pyrroline-5-carboxylate reductase [Clostridia bacterium]